MVKRMTFTSVQEKARDVYEQLLSQMLAALFPDFKRRLRLSLSRDYVLIQEATDKKNFERKNPEFKIT